MEEGKGTINVVAEEAAKAAVDMRLILGKKQGQRYSQEAVEFGCEVMSHNVGAQTAKEMIRTFMNR